MPKESPRRRLADGPCRWLAVAALVAGALVGAPASAAGGEAHRPKVLFIGIDGASWKVIGPLIDKGQLPAFAGLVREGAHAPDFGTLGGGASPLIWTSIVTGRAPEDHGITSFVTEMRGGNVRVPVTSSGRKAKAIWEVATENGQSAGVVGYWATWPAEPIDGYVITDHANTAFSEFMVADGRMWVGADPARLSQLQRDFHPLDLGPTLAEHWVTREGFSYQDMQRRGGFSDVQIELLRAAEWNVFADYYSLLKTMYRVDLPLFRVAKDLMVKRPTDLLIVYFHGPDPIQHMAWDLAEPEAYAVPNPHLERDRGLVEGVYRAMDWMVGELMAQAGPETWVIVASDHGVEPSPAATGDPRQGRPGEHPETAKGVLFVRGPHVKAGHRIAGATPYDLMSTFVWLLGLPLSEELEGRVLSEVFEKSFVDGRKVEKVASYGGRQTADPQRSPSDQLMLDLLKGLGYIGN